MAILKKYLNNLLIACLVILLILIVNYIVPNGVGLKLADKSGSEMPLVDILCMMAGWLVFGLSFFPAFII